MTLNTQPLDEYFHLINKEKQDMPIWTHDEEPLTKVYFMIRSPAVAHYPANEHNVSLEWQEGATWHQVMWEIVKVVETQYGYSLRDKVFFQVHDLVIQAEEEMGDPDLAKQMFSKDLS